jgi:ribosomal protein S18 acetylase RimI-like enzyme
MKKKQKIKIREFQIDDYDILVELWKKTGLPYKDKGRDSREKMKKEMEHGCAVFLLAEISSELVGSVLATHDGRKGWINRVAVLPEYRNQGIATLLVKEAEKRLYNFGIEIIACLIEGWNKTSMEVFPKLGYKKFEDIHYFTKRKYPEV